MRPRRALVATALLLALAGCAASDQGGGAAAPPAEPGERRYQATGMVLESPDHGPQLCLGVILTSFPPQCEGLPIPNWRWVKVEGEQAADGTTWGSYQVVGAYDGDSFTVDRAAPAPPEPQPSPEEQFKDEAKSPCQEPAGGWELPDPARGTHRHLESVARVARAEPDFAGMWVSYLAPMGNNVAEDPGEFVLNVTFTGDLARHQAELRPRWGGRLCVAQHPRSYRQLEAIQRELQGEVGRELGLRVLGTGLVENANAVSLTVTVLEEQARAAIDARYGSGTVQADAALRPVP